MSNFVPRGVHYLVITRIMASIGDRLTMDVSTRLPNARLRFLVQLRFLLQPVVSECIIDRHR